MDRVGVEFGIAQRRHDLGATPEVDAASMSEDEKSHRNQRENKREEGEHDFRPRYRAPSGPSSPPMSECSSVRSGDDVAK